MANEIQINPELEIIEKLAVVVVFLLAGLYLWQFLGDKEIAKSITEPIDDVAETSFSKNHQFEDRNTVNVKQKEVIKENELLVSSNEERNLQSVAIKTKKNIDLAQSPKETATAKVNNAIPKEELLPPAAPIIEKKTVEVPAKEKKVFVPTIDPIKSDLSQGMLKLSGKGQSGSRLLLLLNGKNFSDIWVDQKGVWKYEANLTSGEYSVQVLTPDLNQQVKSQTAITRISIPEGKPLEEEIKSLQKEISALKKQTKKTVNTDLEVKTAVNSSKKISNDYYRVQYGDTLNIVAKRYKVSLASLIKANAISDKDVIDVGEKLIIPGHYLGNSQ